jgi:hypothetical protein
VSESIAATADPQDRDEAPEHEVEGVRQRSVVVTEPAAAAFSTAAAVGSAPTKPRAMVALQAMFRSSSGSPPPPRRHYPPRFYAFLEDAATERGMHKP